MMKPRVSVWMDREKFEALLKLLESPSLTERIEAIVRFEGESGPFMDLMCALDAARCNNENHEVTAEEIIAELDKSKAEDAAGRGPRRCSVKVASTGNTNVDTCNAVIRDGKCSLYPDEHTPGPPMKQLARAHKKGVADKLDVELGHRPPHWSFRAVPAEIDFARILREVEETKVNVFWLRVKGDALLGIRCGTPEAEVATRAPGVYVACGVPVLHPSRGLNVDTSRACDRWMWVTVESQHALQAIQAERKRQVTKLRVTVEGI